MKTFYCENIKRYLRTNLRRAGFQGNETNHDLSNIFHKSNSRMSITYTLHFTHFEILKCYNLLKRLKKSWRKRRYSYTEKTIERIQLPQI